MVGLSARENRSYASELAERGFVTLAPSYPLLANYQIEPADCGFESGTMMAIWEIGTTSEVWIISTRCSSSRTARPSATASPTAVPCP